MPNGHDISLFLEPTLAHLGPIQITWHGLFASVGTLLGVWLAVRWAQQAGIAEDDTLSVAMWGVMGALIGARLFHVVDHWELYRDDPLAILKVNEGGVAIYGAVVGGFLLGVVRTRQLGLSIPRLVDVAVVPLMLGAAIGRIGDIINGEHHGLPADGFPLAVVYTHPDTLGELGKPVHLAVGYEMLLTLTSFIMLVWLARGVVRRADGSWAWHWQPRYPRDGMLFWTFLVLYSVARLVEAFYVVGVPGALGLTEAQVLSVVSGTTGLWVLGDQLARSRPGRRRTQAQARRIGAPGNSEATVVE